MEQSPLTHQPRPEVFTPKIVRLYEELFKVCPPELHASCMVGRSATFILFYLAPALLLPRPRARAPGKLRAVADGLARLGRRRWRQIRRLLARVLCAQAGPTGAPAHPRSDRTQRAGAPRPPDETVVPTGRRCATQTAWRCRPERVGREQTFPLLPQGDTALVLAAVGNAI